MRFVLRTFIRHPWGKKKRKIKRNSIRKYYETLNYTGHSKQNLGIYFNTIYNTITHTPSYLINWFICFNNMWLNFLWFSQVKSFRVCIMTPFQFHYFQNTDLVMMDCESLKYVLKDIITSIYSIYLKIISKKTRIKHVCWNYNYSYIQYFSYIGCRSIFGTKIGQ